VSNLAKLIGNRIKEMRKRKGLRQEDMENFGLNYRYYQDIEAGKANLTLATIAKIASALDVDVTDLFSMPFSPSTEGAELISEVEKIVRKDDRDAIRKLMVVIREII
jgi:transcriptional regulator with XRE-family HTH domain